ncbi:B12-binding domain-containing radical SAM protein [bacterium]|nr:B12-binding domain-containing radical SAM protein [bacterium]
MDINEIMQQVIPNRFAVDILFIHADSFYDVGMSMFSIGTLYVATVCQQSGFAVKCLGTQQLFGMDKNALRQNLMLWKPKMVGFYAVIDNLHNVKRYASWIKKWLPAAVTVIGGPMASISPEELVKYPAFDYVVPGEGEYVMRDLANSLIRGTIPLDQVASIVYKDGESVRVHPRAPLIEDLDSLPFPNHDLVNMTHGQHISTGRGCPYRCAFCFKEEYNTRFRCRSAQNIADEIITRMEKQPVTNVYITDDVFAVDYKRALEFSRIITEYRRKTKRDFIFFCEGRAEVIAKHPEMLDALTEAGMARLQIGIESGDLQMLRDYGKNLKPEHVLATVEHAQRLQNLTVGGNFIIGGPHETDATLQKSLDFAKTLLRTAPAVFECTNAGLSALPGTSITNNPDRYGIKVLDTDFLKGMTLSDAYCETEALNRNGIRNWCNTFDSEVYKTMQEIIYQADYSTIARHANWAQKWHMFTFYYSMFIGCNELLQQYFNFLASPRFKRLGDIPRLELSDYVPMRTIPKRLYSKDGRRIIFPACWGKKFSLGKPLEKMLYEYASSKLTIGDIAALLKKELKLDKNIPQIIAHIMLPIYSKLEDKYQIVFYR